jgi:hypothetical protein
MRTFNPPKCESCISYDYIKCSCREESSPLFGGSISPLHLACSSFIGLSKVYAPKNRVKKWYKVRTVDDMSDSKARLY